MLACSPPCASRHRDMPCGAPCKTSVRPCRSFGATRNRVMSSHERPKHTCLDVRCQRCVQEAAAPPSPWMMPLRERVPCQWRASLKGPMRQSAAAQTQRQKPGRQHPARSASRAFFARPHTSCIPAILRGDAAPPTALVVPRLRAHARARRLWRAGGGGFGGVTSQHCFAEERHNSFRTSQHESKCMCMHV